MFFSLLLTSSSLVVFSQADQHKPEQTFRRNQIGIQLNPYINNRLLSSGGLRIIDVVSSLRYGYRITKNVTTGVEFSSQFPININSGYQFHYFNFSGYNISFFFKYSILADKRFQLFAEASPYVSHFYREWTSSSDHSAIRFNKMGFYVAPGLTLYSKSKRISFDLYYKFSNISFINGNKSVISYKVNYNF